MRGIALWLAVAAVGCCGCEPPRNTTSDKPEPEMFESVDDEARQILSPAEPAANGADDATSQDQPAEDEAETVRTERKKATVGVGKAGKSLDYEMGTTAAKTYFAARERIVFNVQIPQAMQLYKATTGHDPKTHDEFMEKIIDANAIKLPKLPSGEKYVYDPETAELMVEHPKKK